MIQQIFHPLTFHQKARSFESLIGITESLNKNRPAFCWIGSSPCPQPALSIRLNDIDKSHISYKTRMICKYRSYIFYKTIFVTLEQTLLDYNVINRTNTLYIRLLTMISIEQTLPRLLTMISIEQTLSRTVPCLPLFVRPRDGPDDRDAGLGLPPLHQHLGRQPAWLLQTRVLLSDRRNSDFRYFRQS